MARDTATAQTISKTAGRDVTMAAFVTANGGVYDNSDQTAFMIFINTGTAKVITISTDKTVSNQEAGITSKTFTLPATSEVFIMPVLENQFWAQVGTDNIHVDVDADTGLTWAVVKLA